MSRSFKPIEMVAAACRGRQPAVLRLKARVDFNMVFAGRVMMRTGR
ncbi:MAG TPA: hypothetical protein VKX28_01470 [Xanthobacteraceae bacterium]|nr:hypothetical protein [Xanthobacteraceae bacterium]